MLRFAASRRMPGFRTGMGLARRRVCLRGQRNRRIDDSAPVARRPALHCSVRAQPLKIIVSLKSSTWMSIGARSRCFPPACRPGKRGYSTPGNLQHPRKAPLASLEYLFRRADAVHAAADLVWHRAACFGPCAGVSRLARLHPAAAQLRQQAVRQEPMWAARRRHARETPRRGDCTATLLQPKPLNLVTMDARTALRQRLAHERGDVSASLCRRLRS